MWIYLEKLKDLMIQTALVTPKWFELGLALGIPIDVMERLDDKYHDKPRKALTRVYCHWLENGIPSIQDLEVKLIEALKKIKEYTLAVTLERDLVS